MTINIPRLRLHNQFLSQTEFTEPDQVVMSLGAVQAQDYAGAKWALGLRLKDATDAAIEKAFDQGKILRTHVMRPTWHFVAPEDIRWILALTGPRVHVVNGFMYRQQELDRSLLRKSYLILEKTLQGNKQLTRTELGLALEKARIKAEGIRLGYIMMSAELDGIICSGARRGKQFTYALLEERVPPVKAWEREEALVELTRRYFSTRGPATLQDFTWWSGLTMEDARQGMALLKSQFARMQMNGQTYWFDGSVAPQKEISPAAHLLPNYDEYFIGFKDRSAIAVVAQRAGITADDPSLIAHIIILDGQVVGGWRRTLKKKLILLAVKPFTTLREMEERAIAEAASRYGRFLGLPVELAV